MRCHPVAVRLKELVDARAYGDLFQLAVWTEQHTHYPPGHWALEAAKLGGGQLFSHGCYYINLLLWFLGDPVEGTHVGTNYGTPWMEREGTSNVAIRFASGALGYHFGTWGARGTRLGYSFHALLAGNHGLAAFLRSARRVRCVCPPQAAPTVVSRADNI